MHKIIGLETEIHKTELCVFKLCLHTQWTLRVSDHCNCRRVRRWATLTSKLAYTICLIFLMPLCCCSNRERFALLFLPTKPIKNGYRKYQSIPSATTAPFRRDNCLPRPWKTPALDLNLCISLFHKAYSLHKYYENITIFHGQRAKTRSCLHFYFIFLIILLHCPIQKANRKCTSTKTSCYWI